MAYSPDLLEDLYDNLRAAYIRTEPQKKPKSIYLALLSMASKTRRMRILLDASAPIGAAKANDLEQLLQSNYIEHIEQGSKVTLTSKGIWAIETEKGIIDQESLLEFIDSKWFDCFAETRRTLTDKEKVLLFTTLAARAFSVDSAVNLNDEKTYSGWHNAIKLSYEFLGANNIIKSIDKEAILQSTADKKTSLQPLLHFFRYSENLPKITGGVFVAKNLNYFLDLYKDKTIQQEKLVYLFKLVFSQGIDYKLMKTINDFCIKFSYDISPKVYTLQKHIFAASKFDDFVEDALREFTLNST